MKIIPDSKIVLVRCRPFEVEMLSLNILTAAVIALQVLP